MTQQPDWNQSPPGNGFGQPPNHNAQPPNYYGQPADGHEQAPAPYMPQQTPRESMATLNSALRRGLLMNVAFLGFVFVFYAVGGRLPWIILVVGVASLVMTLVRYFRGRARIQGR